MEGLQAFERGADAPGPAAAIPGDLATDTVSIVLASTLAPSRPSSPRENIGRRQRNPQRRWLSHAVSAVRQVAMWSVSIRAGSTGIDQPGLDQHRARCAPRCRAAAGTRRSGMSGSILGRESMVSSQVRVGGRPSDGNGSATGATRRSPVTHTAEANSPMACPASTSLRRPSASSSAPVAESPAAMQLQVEQSGVPLHPAGVSPGADRAPEGDVPDATGDLPTSMSALISSGYCALYRSRTCWLLNPATSGRVTPL